MNEEILSHLAIIPYDRDDRCPPDAHRLGEYRRSKTKKIAQRVAFAAS